MNTPRQRLPYLRFYTIIYVTMLVFGVVETVKSVALPAIKEEFGITYTETGGLISFAWFGYVVLCFVVTLFLQRFGIKNSILGGYVLIIGGCLLTLVAREYYLVMVALFMVHASFGFFEVGDNALAMKIFTTKTALLLSLMHFFYGLGAVIGPHVASAVMQSPLVVAAGNGGWRWIYLVLGIPLVAVTLLVLLTRFGGNSRNAKQEQGGNAVMGTGTAGAGVETDIDRVSQKLTFSKVLAIPSAWVFIAMLGLMEVVEFGAANWAPFYLRDVHGFDPEVQGAMFVSVFYILFTLSRLVGGFATEKAGYYRSMIACVGMTIVLYLAGFLLHVDGIWILACTGIFIAQFWILILAIAERKFKQEAAIVTSVIITMSGLINGLFQVVIGMTNEFIGDAWGYRSCLLYAAIVLVLGIVFKKKLLEKHHVAPSSHAGDLD